ncbi:MAG: hypothetical protein JWL63_1369 [Rhodocyclales bacterium]|nr:hypothetical protein [Rhodocyclales bacterium]
MHFSMHISTITPDWSAPPNVKAFVTTRHGGVSAGPYQSLNLGDHVGDAVQDVAENRRRLSSLLPAAPRWLRQVHGVKVCHADNACGDDTADAVLARQADVVCAIMTADCLPVLLTDRAGSVVAVAHAGWRGLCDGVLEACVASMQAAPAELIAWLGPAIGPAHFEVGPEVREAFLHHSAEAAMAFRPGKADRWMADIFLLARQRLSAAGVPATAISGGDLCTVSDADRFFSYRRDGITGRMASLIWRESADSAG